MGGEKASDQAYLSQSYGKGRELEGRMNAFVTDGHSSHREYHHRIR